MLSKAIDVMHDRLPDIISTVFVLSVFQRCVFGQSLEEKGCVFPESEQRPFFFDISSAEPIGSVVIDTIVEPSDAQISIGSIRSRNLVDVDFSKRFALRRQQNRFSLIVNENIHLPPYPSSIRETYLYITIICNQRSYPLITVRITHKNLAAPHFYGKQPYSIDISKATTIGTAIETPILAIDWDPSTNYAIEYDIVDGNEDGYFELDSSNLMIHKPNNLPTEFNEDSWNLQQLPHIVRLILRKNLDFDENNRLITLNISASDSDETGPMSSYALLEIHVVNASEKEQQGGNAPFFKKCFYDASIIKNALVGTPIVQVEMADDIKEDAKRLQLTDASGIFTINPENGIISIANSEKLNQEQNNTFTIFATFEKTTNAERNETELCDRATIQVTYADANSNSPSFEKDLYKFTLPKEVQNGSTIGYIQANDSNEGSHGRIIYRLLNSSVPFAIHESDGVEGVQIITNFSSGQYNDISDAYTLIVEAVNLSTSRSAQSIVRVEKGKSQTTTDATIKNQIKLKKPDKAISSGYKREHSANTGFDDEQHEALGASFAFEQPTYRFGIYLLDDFVGKVRAIDRLNRNARIVYSITGSNAAHFTIDSNSGDIKIGDRSAISSQKKLSFSVIASNLSNKNRTATAVISVIIDSAEAVDLPPRFESRHYSLAIAENAEPQRIGVVQAYHPFAGDSDPIVYSVLPGVDSALFTVNANSGVVSSLQPFDYEDKKLYQFQVSGCLLHNKTFCGFSNVTVTVSDENDNSPEFEQPSYSVDLPIDTPVGTEIVRLSASDKDSGNNADVSYALKTPSAIFSLDYQSGLLKTVVPFPEAKKFHLVVEAFDHGYPTRRQSADVFVNVHDNNPSAPEFDQFRYDVTKLAPVPAGSVLVTLHADDPDPGLEGQIVYRFAPTEDARAAVDLSKFTINPKTGQLSTKARLTSEDSNPLQFVVEAVDQSPTFPRKTQTVVRINILSDSVEQVAFLPLPKRVYISTSKVPGSVILKVSATRTSAPPVFSAKEHDEANYFEMVGDELRVKSKLVEGSVNVTLRVDAGSAFAEHILNVVIMAERDKYPVFPHLTYDVQVPVNATFPLLAQTFVAALAHGTVVYGTYPSDSLPVGLTLDAATGDLYASKEFVGAFYDKPTIFIVIRARNAEYPQFYSDVGVALSVSSSDRGFSFPVQLYRLMLRENSPPGTVLNTTVTVGNRAAYDGVKYELRPSELFSIDDDGVIRSRVSIDAEKLSRDSRGIIEMIVIAHNGKEKANATVQIKIEDVNEYVPKFDRLVYNVDVPENVEPGHLIVAVHAFDKDFSEGDRLTYKITKGDEQSLLLITQNGSIYKSDSGRFDHEMTKVFNVTVIGVDKDGNSAETTVQIHVSDVNDNEPKIEEPLVWNVTEGKKGVGSKFIISATDADADHNGLVSFNIIQGNKNHSFNLKSLPENRAELSVISELDREVAARHLLTIEARDHGSPPLFSVATVFVNVVDENDTPPYFIQDDYKQTVPMDLPVGFPLLTVRAEDDDLNSKLVYSIRSDPSNMFAINKDTGAISFSANVSDRIVGLYEVAVDVNDGIHSSTVIVSVDVYRPNGTVNSNATETTQSKLNRAPTFLSDSYEFSVNEGIVGPIGSVNFWDPDNDSVILSVEPKSYRNLFAVDQINGTLSVLKALSYSMERERYTFLVLATDTGRPPLTAFANVIVTVIDVNDHKPEFDRRDYSAIIPSAVSTPYTVPLGIIVRDGDSGENAQIRFTLKGADADCFSVDSSLGSLTFDCAIDYVHKTNYTLKMVATDLNGRGHSSEADLVIFIAPPTTLPVVPTSSLEISGNNADISSSVDEANEVCSVSFVRSTDEIMFQLDRPLDEPLYAVQTRCSCEEHCSTHYSISDPSLQPYFTVLPNGQLKLVKKLSVSALKSKHLLDKSGKLMIPIQLKTDEGSVSQLTLFVLPQESRQTDDVTSTTAASVSTLSYYNKLTGAGSYDGSASSESVQRAESMVVPVDVDITSGTTKKGALSWSGGDGIVTGVAPLPTALPSKESSNHPPTFPYELYKSLMPEGRYGSGALLSLKPSEIRAEDVDEGKEGFVTYHIESERPSIPFFIRNTTGELIIFGNIDREETTQYAFDVVATDQGDPPLSGRTRVEVKILDVNDNYPVFMEAPIVVPLLEDVPLGTVVATIHAEDADEGRFGEVRFSLLNYTDTFTIDSKSGVLRTAKQLSTGENDVYKLTIVASDLGKPALKSTFEMRVEVFSSANEVPQFKRSTYSVTVESNALAGRNITQVVAGPKGLKYSLADSFSGLFDISNDGVISLGRLPIKSEQNRYHFLNVTATNDEGQSATTALNVFLEGERIVALATTSPPNSSPEQCRFLSKLYNAEILENQPGRHKLTKVTSNCEKDGRPYEYIIAQGSMEFEVDPIVGELFVEGPLDREKRSLHFVIVNVTTNIDNSTDAVRPTRQTNPVIEHTKSKLEPWQTLVAIHVLDENDNEPQFVKLNSEGIYVFSVDWQAPLLTPIARVHAEDADGRVPLIYSISESTVASADHFMLNQTSGVIALSKSLVNDRSDFHEFEVVVSDGVHNVTTPVRIYRLAPESNIVLLSADIPQQDIEDWSVERKMSDLTNEDVRILVKQAYVNEDGQVNPQRTHLFVYALDKNTHIPVGRDRLKTILEQSRSTLDGDLPKLAITLPAVDSTGRVSLAELLLIVICVILLLIACCMLFYLAKYCKRKATERFTGEYMVDSHSAGPRPYDVEQIDRKTAQSVLSSRPLPDPYEPNKTYDMNLRASPPINSTFISDTYHAHNRFLKAPLNSRQLGDAYGTIGPRSKNFSGDVMQVHTLVNNRSDKEVTLSSALQTSKDGALFPIYRSQGYSS